MRHPAGAGTVRFPLPLPGAADPDSGDWLPARHSALEGSFQTLLAQSGVHPRAISAAASIDRKEREPGLLAFCRAHGWSCRFYSAAQLAALPGEFTPSEFVQSVTGVDNVCERSAVCASGGGLYWRKCAGNGVTLALAQAPYTPNWRWQRDDVS